MRPEGQEVNHSPFFIDIQCPLFPSYISMVHLQKNLRNIFCLIQLSVSELEEAASRYDLRYRKKQETQGTTLFLLSQLCLQLLVERTYAERNV